MPYIPQNDRKYLDQHINALAEELKSIAATYQYEGAFAGLLNYSCTTLALKVNPGPTPLLVYRACNRRIQEHRG